MDKLESILETRSFIELGGHVKKEEYVEDITYLLQLVEYPKAVGADFSNGGWDLDYKFLSELEKKIKVSTFGEDAPSMEQIELTLLFATEMMKERADLSHIESNS